LAKISGKNSDNPAGDKSGCEKTGENLAGRGISREAHFRDSKSRTCDKA